MLANYIDRVLSPGTLWRTAQMVAQQRLGLCPDRRVGNPLDRDHSPGSRPDLSRVGVYSVTKRQLREVAVTRAATVASNRAE